MHTQVIRQLNKRGTTCLVQDIETGEYYVQKIVSDEQIEMYNTIREINSNFVPEIIEISEREGKKGLLLYEKYIEGYNLDSRQYSEFEAISIVRAIADIIKDFHTKGIVHRDIKPTNIIMGKDGKIYLIDFGIARVHKAGQNKDTYLLGTEGYAAPEQYGFGQSDYRTDIYALGVLANYLITGEYPAFKHYDGIYSTIVDKCTQLNADNRFQSAEELIGAIDNALAVTERHIRWYIPIGIALVVICLVLVAIMRFGYKSTAEDNDTYSTATETDTATNATTTEPSQTEVESTTYELMDGELVKGACGPTVIYVIKDDGTVIFTGEGMIDNSQMSDTPWKACTKAIIEEGITGIAGKEMFAECDFEEITLPSTLKYIGNSAFKNYVGSTIIIPDAVDTIGNNAFMNAVNLTEIILPDTLSSIGELAFYGDANLSINIPSKVSKIGNYAFYGNEMLKEVTIPANATIGNGAFYHCNNLRTLHIEEGTKRLTTNSLSGLKYLEKLYLPASLTTVEENVIPYIEDLYNVLNIYYSGSYEQFKDVIQKNLYIRSYKIKYHVAVGTAHETIIN